MILEPPPSPLQACDFLREAWDKALLMGESGGLASSPSLGTKSGPDETQEAIFSSKPIPGLTSFPCTEEPTEPKREESELERTFPPKLSMLGASRGTPPVSSACISPLYPVPGNLAHRPICCSLNMWLLSLTFLHGLCPLLGMPSLLLPICQDPVIVVLSRALSLMPNQYRVQCPLL